MTLSWIAVQTGRLGFILDAVVGILKTAYAVHPARARRRVRGERVGVRTCTGWREKL